MNTRGALSYNWANEGKELSILAKYGALDRPLRIGDIKISCYVLADGRRVLSQRGLHSGIGLSEGGGREQGARKIATLMHRLSEKGIDVKNLVERANSPIKFVPTHGGRTADGYEATILPDICAVIIEASGVTVPFGHLSSEKPVNPPLMGFSILK